MAVRRVMDTGRERPDHLQRIVYADGRVEERTIQGDYTTEDARRALAAVKAGGSESVETKDGRRIIYGRVD